MNLNLLKLIMHQKNLTCKGSKIQIYKEQLKTIIVRAGVQCR